MPTAILSKKKKKKHNSNSIGSLAVYPLLTRKNEGRFGFSTPFPSIFPLLFPPFPSAGHSPAPLVRGIGRPGLSPPPKKVSPRESSLALSQREAPPPAFRRPSVSSVLRMAAGAKELQSQRVVLSCALCFTDSCKSERTASHFVAILFASHLLQALCLIGT